MRWLPIAVLLVVAGAVAWAQDAAVPGLEGVAFSLWQPSESYPGGAQDDPRLDNTIRVWRAAIPVGELFSDIEQQTGIRLAFWPDDDANRGFRLTLYLNPHDPPSVRELMAQIMWVTDCVFAFADDDKGQRVYYLLGTSEGRSPQGPQTIEEVYQQIAAQQKAADRARVRAKLPEYRNALRLSREDAIARYQGVDDMLLLNLIDPRQCAFTHLVCSLPESDLNTMLSEGRLAREWGDWTEEQRADLREALDFQEEWLKKGTIRIWIGVGDYVNLIAAVDETDEFLRQEPVISIWASDEPMHPRERILLRRALGEEISEEEYWRFIRDYWDRYYAEKRKGVDELTRAKMLAEPALSDDVRQRLSELTFPWDTSTYYPLWQVQEAVAQTTGMNVISDTFAFRESGAVQWGMALLDEGYRQQTAERAQRVDAWAREHEAEMKASRQRPAELERLMRMTVHVSALNWLISLCHPGSTGINDMVVENFDGVEWADAGPFLHFRSQHRDLFRAAIWPPALRQRVLDWFGPQLDEIAASDKLPAAMKTPVALPDLAYAAGRLTDVQLKYGGIFLYEDPTTPAGFAKNRVWESAGHTLDRNTSLLRLLASFTPSQWELLRGKGLRWGSDLTPDQQAMPFGQELTRALSSPKPRGRLGDCRLSLRSLRADPDPAAPDSVPPIAVHFVDVKLKGEVIASGDFYPSLQVEVNPMRRLADIVRDADTRSPAAEGSTE